MAIGAVLEPLVIVSLLAGGTLLNRDKSRTTVSSAASQPFRRPDPWQDIEYALGGETPPGERASGDRKDWDKQRSASISSSSTIWHDAEGNVASLSQYRRRTLKFWKWQCEVTTPNTEIHKDRLLSRLLRRYPFLVEVWYWALIYWVCPPLAPVPSVDILKVF